MATVSSGGGSSTTKQSNHVVIVMAIVVGFVVVPYLAKFNATLVNGFLLLVLMGTLLGNSNRWLPYVNQLGSAFK